MNITRQYVDKSLIDDAFFKNICLISYLRPQLLFKMLEKYQDKEIDVNLAELVKAEIGQQKKTELSDLLRYFRQLDMAVKIESAEDPNASFAIILDRAAQNLSERKYENDLKLMKQHQQWLTYILNEPFLAGAVDAIKEHRGRIPLVEHHEAALDVNTTSEVQDAGVEQAASTIDHDPNSSSEELRATDDMTEVMPDHNSANDAPSAGGEALQDMDREISTANNEDALDQDAFNAGEGGAVTCEPQQIEAAPDITARLADEALEEIGSSPAAFLLPADAISERVVHYFKGAPTLVVGPDSAEIEAELERVGKFLIPNGACTYTDDASQRVQLNSPYLPAPAAFSSAYSEFIDRMRAKVPSDTTLKLIEKAGIFPSLYLKCDREVDPVSANDILMNSVRNVPAICVYLTYALNVKNQEMPQIYEVLDVSNNADAEAIFAFLTEAAPEMIGFLLGLTTSVASYIQT